MLFKNKYTETKELFFKRCLVPESITSGALIWFMLGLATMFTQIYYLGIFWFIVAGVSILENHLRIKKWTEKYEGSEHKDAEIALEFYDDHVSVFRNGVETNFKYSYFASLEEDQEFFRLTLHDPKNWEKEKKPSVVFLRDIDAEDRTLIVMKNGFEQGEISEFKKFMKTKKSKGFSVH